MPMHPDYVTNPDFNRWIAEEANFRIRLEARIEAMHTHVKGELSEIKGMVKDANGTGRKNTEAILVIRRDLDALIAEDKEIDKVVQSIRDEGCSQYAAHTAALAQIENWSGKRKAAIGGGLVGIGALMWPALQQMAEALHALLEKLP